MLQHYEDRRQAGRALATCLAQFAGRHDVVVLGLPRGGVPVAFEVAHALSLPLDIWLVRKLGVPGEEELAMGAIASGGVQLLDRLLIWRRGIPADRLAETVARETAELARRERQYRGGGPAPSVAGLTVIVVDDGVATGASMEAAVESLRQAGAAHVVVAVPVGAVAALERLQPLADWVVCPLRPEPFIAVGHWYGHFEQTSDEEVVDLLSLDAVPLQHDKFRSVS